MISSVWITSKESNMRMLASSERQSIRQLVICHLHYSMGDDITRRSNAPGDIGFDREELARLNSSVQSINSEEVSFEDDIDSVNVDFEETDSMEECETWFDSQEDFDMSEDTLNGDMSVTCDQTEAENSASDEEIPIAQQIVNLMQKPGFYTDLQHRFHRKKSDPKNIEDLYDGIQYRRHSHNGGFLDNKNNISFMWYTDGCPIFKSSRLSMWPLYFVINELPLNKRLLKENLIYAGLWFGEKPAMGSFLKPFHESLKQLKEVGISVKVPSDEEPITVRAIVLCGTCDLPARCLVLNMTQFNGAYGCCHCKQKGKSASTGKGTTWTYPFKEVDPKGPKRTHNDMMMDAKKAYTEKKSVDGIKGPTFLSFTGCDLVHGVAIDYMHTVLLGVVGSCCTFGLIVLTIRNCSRLENKFIR
ncbi:hypothetical protein BSL78_01513 [Apostichopus japonicus]|uniref:Transposase domain-containing protein n=1 Tax=Stichopus japonicus TaxID=307972 RepID=A0A2G8LMU6_STIJA|nr:hypothetical protein BSL78_01513 [Apostichopus japonicus]